MKKGRCLLECLFQKYTGQLIMKYQKSHMGQSDTLAFPHTYLMIHINWGNPISSTFVIPHTTLGQSGFIRTLVIPFFFTLQDKQSFAQISSFPLYIQTGAIYMNCLTFKTSLLHYPYFLSNQVFIPPSLKPT